MNREEHLLHPQVVQLLAAGLLPEEEQGFGQHIETCAACRQLVEDTAADASFWREVGATLAEAETQDSMASSTPAVTQAAAGPGVADAASPEEFALTFLEPSDNPAMLGRLGRFEILEEFARGGMGVVLKGYDHELNRFVAVKVLAPQWSASGAARRRFAREAQAAAAIMHPNVMPIHAVDASGKLPYLVMPLIPGESLEQRLQRTGPLELAEILRIAKQVAEGLAAAHAQGIVHRDIKPANVLLETGVDRAVLSDFGLARAVDDASLTRAGSIAGTPDFMSPEQARGEPIDHRSDLFSLGSLLYTMCTARAPFRAETSLGVLRRISDAQPHAIRDINPDIPPWLEGLISKLLAKDPADRLQSAEETARLLGQCLAYVQRPAAVELPHSLSELLPRPTRLTPRTWLAAIAGAVLTIAAIAATTFLPRPALQDTALMSGAPATQGAPESTPDSESPAPFAWNDGLAEELLDLAGDLQSLDEQTVSEWGSKD